MVAFLIVQDVLGDLHIGLRRVTEMMGCINYQKFLAPDEFDLFQSLTFSE
jgi:hypothetical protein